MAMQIQSELDKLNGLKSLLTQGVFDGIKSISSLLDSEWEVISVDMLAQYPAEVALKLTQENVLITSSYMYQQSGNAITVASTKDASTLLSFLMDVEHSGNFLDEFGLSALSEIVHQFQLGLTNYCSELLGITMKSSHPKSEIISEQSQGLSPFEAKILSIVMTFKHEGQEVTLTHSIDFSFISGLCEVHNSKRKDPQAQSNQKNEDVKVKEVRVPKFVENNRNLPESQSMQNLDMIMNVPLTVSIEIGRAKKKIKDIMSMSSGYVLELEKQLGAPVDIVVNGQLIARGDVVVIDENFAIRITEIVNTAHLLPQE